MQNFTPLSSVRTQRTYAPPSPDLLELMELAKTVPTPQNLERYTNRIIELIKKGVPVNNRDTMASSCLHYAINYNNLKFVEILFSNTLREEWPNIMRKQGDYAITKAEKEGKTAIAEYLIKIREQLNSPTTTTQMPNSTAWATPSSNTSFASPTFITSTMILHQLSSNLAGLSIHSKQPIPATTSTAFATTTQTTTSITHSSSTTTLNFDADKRRLLNMLDALRCILESGKHLEYVALFNLLKEVDYNDFKHTPFFNMAQKFIEQLRKQNQNSPGAKLLSVFITPGNKLYDDAYPEAQLTITATNKDVLPNFAPIVEYVTANNSLKDETRLEERRVKQLCAALTKVVLKESKHPLVSLHTYVVGYFKGDQQNNTSYSLNNTFKQMADSFIQLHSWDKAGCQLLEELTTSGKNLHEDGYARSIDESAEKSEERTRAIIARAVEISNEYS